MCFYSRQRQSISFAGTWTTTLLAIDAAKVNSWSLKQGRYSLCVSVLYCCAGRSLRPSYCCRSVDSLQHNQSAHYIVPETHCSSHQSAPGRTTCSASCQSNTISRPAPLSIYHHLPLSIGIVLETAAGELRPVALATGLKCLGGVPRDRHQLRDCHAEVLARRVL